MVDFPRAAAALSISRTTAYALQREGEFPITVHRIGRSLRCRAVDIAAFVGVQYDGAGSSHPTPSENNPIHQR
ncbi:hypothetical protein GCM10010417_04260 [Streptomyces carpaticus]